MNDENIIKCPYCNGEIWIGAQKCKHCGKWLNEQKQACPYCLKEIPANATKCSFCGSVVKRKKSELVKCAAMIGYLCVVFTTVGFGLFAESIGSDPSFGVFMAFLLFLLLEIYFLPTRIAYGRTHKQTNLIFFVNLLLGYTIIGWFATLIWAFIDD